MTPAELWLEFAASQERERDQWQRDIVQAWHTAALAVRGFGGKFPNLRDYLDEITEKKQSIAEQRVQLDAISQAYGLPLRKKTKFRLVKGLAS